jgi:hypothetical protein
MRVWLFLCSDLYAVAGGRSLKGRGIFNIVYILFFRAPVRALAGGDRPERRAVRTLERAADGPLPNLLTLKCGRVGPLDSLIPLEEEEKPSKEQK